MKKLINAPDDVVDEALAGMLAAHPDYYRIEEPNVVVRKDAPRQGKVGIISGGGSGHEPMHGGFVGRRACSTPPVPAPCSPRRSPTRCSPPPRPSTAAPACSTSSRTTPATS